jgi:transcriptional regulator with XRE-family HTH domain
VVRKSSTDSHVAVRIRQIRKTKHLSQAKLALGLGVSLQQVQKYEAGTDRISAGRLFDIAKSLEVPVEILFPSLDGLSADAQKGLDPENEVLSFLSNAQNWRLYCAFRRITDIERRNTLLELAENFAG